MNAQSTLTQLTEQVQKALNLDTIDPETPIGELGFDSMRIVELILICDKLYNTSIDPESIELTQYTSLSDLDRQFLAMPRKNVSTDAAAVR